jgi:glutamate--cysteine ligase
MLTTPASAGLADLYRATRQAVTEPVATADAVGLEVEAFAMTTGGRRLTIADLMGGLDRLGGRSLPGLDPTYRIDGATISFEPGGQIEVSGDPAVSISGAIDSQRTTWQAVSDVVPGALVFAGLDLWNEVTDVALQLDAPRYAAMDTYLGKRTSLGRVMMRNSCSVQINLDGGGDLFGRRLRVAQVLAPFITAAFSTSPTPGWHSGRARVWQGLDPTRTGFLGDIDDPVDAMFEKAMSADVLVIRRGGCWYPGVPGMTFAQWSDDGHAQWGRPSIDDLSYHLTTLFPEVRARRGTLEIRTPDSLPPHLLPALVVLTAAAVYVPAAAEEIIELVSSEDLMDLWRRAAAGGMSDPIVAPLARRIWNIALLAAASLPGSIRSAHLAAAGDYLERYVDRGRTPTDDLRRAFTDHPLQALAWASELSGLEHA